jgi:hypothetical protein
MNWEYAVVDKETVEGDEGYWLEMRMQSPNQADMVMKELLVLHAGMPDIKRMIMQPPGQPPMEMPMGMMSGIMKQATAGQGAGQGAGLGEKLGTEMVSVPAGSFSCDHYRKQTGDNAADIWISTKVSPYGMVKMTSQDMGMVLQKVLTGETSHITGTPRKMEMPHL